MVWSHCYWHFPEQRSEPLISVRALGFQNALSFWRTQYLGAAWLIWLWITTDLDDHNFAFLAKVLSWKQSPKSEVEIQLLEFECSRFEGISGAFAEEPFKGAKSVPQLPLGRHRSASQYFRGFCSVTCKESTERTHFGWLWFGEGGLIKKQEVYSRRSAAGSPPAPRS